MLIASGIEIMWPSTNGSIPAGWTRVTNMDSNYPKGTAAAVNPDVTGGAATHTHTDVSHTHSIAAHTHIGGNTGNNTYDPEVGGYNLLVSSTTPGNNHTHDFGTTSSNSGTNTSTVGTWASSNNDPAYYDVIYIASDGTPNGFPANSWTFWDKTASLPTSWSNPAAARNVFPKGAAAAGNGGGSGGGSHAHTGSGHTHNPGSHTHTGTTGIGTKTTVGSAHNWFPINQTHTYTTGAPSGASSSTTSGNAGTTSYEPSFAKLAIVQNDSGVANIQVRHVAMWAGTLASIPTYWVLCDGTNSTVDMRGKFVKGANGIAEIGNTGGTAGHLHTDAATHTHTYDHTHSTATDFATATTGGSVTAQSPHPSYPPAYGPAHPHDAGSNTTSNGTSGATAQTAPSNADTQPAFRTRVFISLTPIVGPTEFFQTVNVAINASTLIPRGITKTVGATLFTAASYLASLIERKNSSVIFTSTVSSSVTFTVAEE